jgi:hypothetical protein
MPIPFGLRLAQRSRDAFLVLTRGGDGIHAQRDPILDDFVLFRRIGIRRPVEEQLYAQFRRRLVRALLARNEISVPFALGHEGDGEFRAVAAGGIRSLAATRRESDGCNTEK